MLIEIPDSVVDEVILLDRLTSGRLGDTSKPDVERRIDIARYHISELLAGSVIKTVRGINSRLKLK